MIIDWIQRYRLKRLIRQGLQIVDDCRLVSMPDFGSECYLISIGKHVTITSNDTFGNHDQGIWGFRDLERFKESIKIRRITIHENCLISTCTTILPGVSIGPNSAMAAGSVVTGVVPLTRPQVMCLPGSSSPSRFRQAEMILFVTLNYDLAAQ